MAGPGLGASAARDSSGRSGQCGGSEAGGSTNSAAVSRSSSAGAPPRPGSPNGWTYGSEVASQGFETEMWAALRKTFGNDVPDHLQACVRRLTSARAAAEQRTPSESDHGGSPAPTPTLPAPGVLSSPRIGVDPVFTSGERARAITVNKTFTPRLGADANGGSAPATASRTSPQRPRKHGSADGSPPVFERLLRDAKERRSRNSEDISRVKALAQEMASAALSLKAGPPGAAQPQLQPSPRGSSREGRGSSPLTTRPKSARDTSGKASRGSSPASSRVKAYLQGVSLGLTTPSSAPGHPQADAISETAAMSPRGQPIASASPTTAPVPSVAQALSSPPSYAPPAAHGASATTFGSPRIGSMGALGQQQRAAAKSANRRQTPQAHERLFKEATSIHERRRQLSESWQEAEQEKLRKEAQRALHNPLGRSSAAVGATARRIAGTQQSGQRARSPSPADSCRDKAPRSPRGESTRLESPQRARSPTTTSLKGAVAGLSLQVGRKTNEPKAKTVVSSNGSINGKSAIDEDQSSMPTASPPPASSSASATTAGAESELPALAALNEDLVRRDINVMKRQLGLLMVGVDVLKRKVATVEATSASSGNLQPTSSDGDIVDQKVSSSGNDSEEPCKGEEHEVPRGCEDASERTTGDEGEASLSVNTQATPSSYPISRMTSVDSPAASAKAKQEDPTAHQGDVDSAAAEGLAAAVKITNLTADAMDSLPSLSKHSEVLRQSSEKAIREAASDIVCVSNGGSAEVATQFSNGTDSRSEASGAAEVHRYPPDRMQQLPLPLPSQLAKGNATPNAAAEPAETSCTPQRQWVWTGPGGSAETPSPGPMVAGMQRGILVIQKDTSVPRSAARGRRREDPVEISTKRNLADELNCSSESAAASSPQASSAAEIILADARQAVAHELFSKSSEIIADARQAIVKELGQALPPTPRGTTPSISMPPEIALSGRAALQPAHVLPPKPVPRAQPEPMPRSPQVAANAPRPTSRLAGPADIKAKLEDTGNREATSCSEPKAAVVEPLITGDIIYNGRSATGSGRCTGSNQAVNGVEIKTAPLSTDNAQNLPFMEQVTARLVELKKAETEKSASGISTPSKSQAELTEQTTANGL